MKIFETKVKTFSVIFSLLLQLSGRWPIWSRSDRAQTISKCRLHYGTTPPNSQPLFIKNAVNKSLKSNLLAYFYRKTQCDERENIYKPSEIF
jgi:hypothetical protein